MNELLGRLQELCDRQDILDCIQAYSRGIDRHDRHLTISAYHPDGLDDHAAVVRQPEPFADWANEIHDANVTFHQHIMCRSTIELDGDTAHAETYGIVMLPAKEGPTIDLSFNRYIDRLERRDGTWAIAYRVCVVDACGRFDKREAVGGSDSAAYKIGTQDRTDVSYDRPLMGRGDR